MFSSFSVVYGLGVLDGIQIRNQRREVFVVGDAALTWWQLVDEVSGDAMRDEWCAGTNADDRAPRQQNLLQRQRPVVVVGQVGAGARAAS